MIFHSPQPYNKQPDRRQNVQGVLTDASGFKLTSDKTFNPQTDTVGN